MKSSSSEIIIAGFTDERGTADGKRKPRKSSKPVLPAANACKSGWLRRRIPVIAESRIYLPNMVKRCPYR